jgi:hypothetical protein
MTTQADCLDQGCSRRPRRSWAGVIGRVRAQAAKCPTPEADRLDIPPESWRGVPSQGDARACCAVVRDSPLWRKFLFCAMLFSECPGMRAGQAEVVGSMPESERTRKIAHFQWDGFAAVRRRVLRGEDHARLVWGA